MRKAFYEGRSRYMAKKVYPWASKVVKAIGGFWCFESLVDYEYWKSQK